MSKLYNKVSIDQKAVEEIKSEANIINVLEFEDCTFDGNSFELIAQQFPSMTKLRALKVDSLKNQQQIEALSAALSSNTRLFNFEFESPSELDDSSIWQAITPHPKLHYLEVSGQDIKPSSFNKFISENTSVTDLCLRIGNSNNELSSVAEGFKLNTSLKMLTFMPTKSANASLDVDSLNGLNQVLRVTTNLTSIQIHYSLDNANIPELLEALSYNTKLAKLKIPSPAYNPFHPQAPFNAVLPESILNISESLTDLNLYACRLTEDSVDVLSQLLSTRPIKILNLGYNKLGTGGVMLAKALHSNTTLTKIKLSGNNFDHTVCQAMGIMLTKNSTLKNLVFCGDYFSEEGAVDAILNGLKSNSTLVSIKLFHGHKYDSPNTVQNTFLVSKDTDTKIVELLTSQSSHLAKISLPCSDTAKIWPALESNTNLRKISLFTTSSVTSDDIGCIQKLLKSNKNLAKLSIQCDQFAASTESDIDLTPLEEVLQNHFALNLLRIFYITGDLGNQTTVSMLSKSDVISDALDRNETLSATAAEYLIGDKIHFHTGQELRGNIHIAKYFKNIMMKMFFNNIGKFGDIIKFLMVSNKPLQLASLDQELKLLDGSDKEIKLFLTPHFFQKNFFKLFGVCKKFIRTEDVDKKQQGHISSLPEEIINHITSYLALEDMPITGDLNPESIASMWDGMMG